MYPASVPSEIATMIQTGVLDLKAFRPKTISLNQINEAIIEASQSGGLNYVILQP